METIERDRSRDVLVIDVRTGHAIVDNTDTYFPLLHLFNTMPGTREFNQRESRYET